MGKVFVKESIKDCKIYGKTDGSWFDILDPEEKHELKDDFKHCSWRIKHMNEIVTWTCDGVSLPSGGVLEMCKNCPNCVSTRK